MWGQKERTKRRKSLKKEKKRVGVTICESNVGE